MDDIINKIETGSTTGTGTTTNYVPSACIHKLPCGYCTMLRQICPMQFSGTIMTPTWQDIDITCDNSKTKWRS